MSGLDRWTDTYHKNFDSAVVGAESTAQFYQEQAYLQQWVDSTNDRY